MKKFTFLLALLTLCAGSLVAQNPNRITIKGTVGDTTGEKLSFATVMLLNPKDSTLVNFTRSGDNGEFAFKNVKNTPYLLKISYVAYLPYQKYIPENATETVDVGLLNLKPISAELMEVVIKATKAPLSIRGDTVEYDATTFKVPPGSTVEDLLRRLPGIEVDADGNIKAQGKDVKRVYVDGKTFFGDDPKSATKNLGAETISKVQVYNEKSEQAKLTGVDDGKKEKAMNLELKEEYKKGTFGKVTAAGGTKDRWAGRGNLNKFDPKQQLSFIGYGNNINQTGVNWEDYSEFKGQSSFSGDDNGDFGFTSGRRYYYFDDDGDTPLNFFDGRGFTKNFGAGTNYNYDHKKVKFNSSYFYNQTDLSLDATTQKQTFFSDNSFTNEDTLARGEFRSNHNISTRLEYNIDSSDLLMVTGKLRIGGSNTSENQSQLFSDDKTGPANRLAIDNASDLNSMRLNSTVIYRHRFKKQRRSFAMSGGFNQSNSDGSDNLFSINKFFEANTLTDQIRQLNNRTGDTRQFKSSALFTESFKKKWFWEVFYNFSQTQNQVDRRVNDPERNGQRIDSLSVYYDNKVMYNRLGSSIRYSKNGLNATVGLAAQQINLFGAYSVAPGQPLLAPEISRKFRNMTPIANFNYEFANNLGINGSYSYSIEEPKLNDLQPVPNVNNPLFRQEGNPNLAPQRSHSMDGGLNYWNPSNFANFSLGAEYRKYESQIVYNSTVEVTDKGIRTTSRPDNVAGGQRLDFYLWSSFPLIKTKLNMNISGNVNAGQAPAFVNGELNETTDRGFSSRIGFSLTPGKRLILGIDGNMRLNNIEYSIQSSQNQQILNYGTEGSVKWQFAPKTFLESNFKYNVYENDRFGFNQSIPIWNGSVRRILGKGNRLEMRLAAFDILNKNVSIQQFANQNYVTKTVTGTLARYFMLSVSYNVRGYESKLSKNNWW